MIKHKNKKGSKKKETKYSSLIVRWMTIVSLTITVSFIIFSVVIYSTVSNQSLSQQQRLSDRVVETLNSTLSPIPDELQVNNVIPALSPSVRSALTGGPSINVDRTKGSAFSDEMISSIANPDIDVAVYNLHDEIVFSSGSNVPPFKKFSGNDKDEIVRNKNHQSILKTYRRIQSIKTDKTIGYVVVENQMTYYNRLMRNLLQWMIGISVAAIIVFILISYFIVRDVVRPIKEISKVARDVDEDPNSDARVPNLHRNDEIGNLALSLNNMLDRMQRYIDQQKQFVSDVSHELRTPVAVIEGHLNLLERWGKDDPQVLDESIHASLQEADRMKHLIQEMLDLTRAEQIDVQYPNAVTNVNMVLTRVVSDMSLVHPDFNIQLDSDDLPEDTYIKMYQGHFEQVLVILIDNAIKYSTDRKQINVSAGVMQNTLHIIVQDFGEGISAENQKRIFNRFYRVDKARTREKGGNGLGLSIAQKLVLSYNGTIGVDSVEGQGSQFKITIPVISKEKAEQLSQQK